MFIILISACADPVNRPEIKSLHFGCSFDARIGRTGFITARVPREETYLASGIFAEWYICRVIYLVVDIFAERYMGNI